MGRNPLCMYQDFDKFVVRWAKQNDSWLTTAKYLDLLRSINITPVAVFSTEVVERMGKAVIQTAGTIMTVCIHVPTDDDVVIFTLIKDDATFTYSATPMTTKLDVSTKSFVTSTDDLQLLFEKGKSSGFIFRRGEWTLNMGFEPTGIGDKIKSLREVLETVFTPQLMNIITLWKTLVYTLDIDIDKNPSVFLYYEDELYEGIQVENGNVSTVDLKENHIHISYSAENNWEVTTPDYTISDENGLYMVSGDASIAIIDSPQIKAIVEYIKNSIVEIEGT